MTVISLTTLSFSDASGTPENQVEDGFMLKKLFSRGKRLCVVFSLGDILMKSFYSKFIQMTNKLYALGRFSCTKFANVYIYWVRQTNSEACVIFINPQ